MCEYEKRNYEKVQDDAKRVVAEFLEQAKLKKGDLVAVQKLDGNNMYVILARVVSA